MKKIIVVAIACILSITSHAQQLPKGKLIKDIVVGSRGSNPSRFFAFKNSIFVRTSTDNKYYKINESLNAVELAPTFDSSASDIYKDNDKIIYIKYVDSLGIQKKEIWLYKASTNTRRQISTFRFDDITSNGDVANNKLYFYANFKKSPRFESGVKYVLAYIDLGDSDDNLKVKLVDFYGSINQTRLQWFVKNNSLYCTCTGTRLTVSPWVAEFEGQLCEISLIDHSVKVYKAKEILRQSNERATGIIIYGMLGDYIFFGYGIDDINGFEPYSFNTITKEYRLIKDLSPGKTVQNDDASSSISSFIYDNDYLYFTASSNASPMKLNRKLYSFRKNGEIVDEELSYFFPVLPLNNGYVLLKSNDTLYIRNVITKVTKVLIDEQNKKPFVFSGLLDMFNRNVGINRGEKDLANTYYFEKDGKFVVSFNGNFHLIEPEKFKISPISNNIFTDENSMVTANWFFKQTLNNNTVRFFYSGSNSKVGPEPAYMDYNFDGTATTSRDSAAISQGGALGSAIKLDLFGTAPWTVILKRADGQVQNFDTLKSISTNTYLYVPVKAGTYTIFKVNDNIGSGSGSAIISPNAVIDTTKTTAIMSGGGVLGSQIQVKFVGSKKFPLTYVYAYKVTEFIKTTYKIENIQDSIITFVPGITGPYVGEYVVDRFDNVGEVRGSALITERIKIDTIKPIATMSGGGVLGDKIQVRFSGSDRFPMYYTYVHKVNNIVQNTYEINEIKDSIITIVPTMIGTYEGKFILDWFEGLGEVRGSAIIISDTVLPIIKRPTANIAGGGLIGSEITITIEANGSKAPWFVEVEILYDSLGAKIPITERFVILNSPFSYPSKRAGAYRIVAVNENTAGNGEAIVYIEDRDASEVFVWNAVSPNGDGKNDFFEIEIPKKLENKSAKIVIFDREGTILANLDLKIGSNLNLNAARNMYVYQWNCNNNSDELLTPGTYFYSFKVKDFEKDSKVSKSGFIEIRR